jgi:myosin heavy subunit
MQPFPPISLVLQVSYSTDNFLVKNRDFVVAEHQLLLENSSETFIKVLFPAEVEAESAQVLTKCSSNATLWLNAAVRASLTYVVQCQEVFRS